jgi:chromosome segregation ATPase
MTIGDRLCRHGRWMGLCAACIDSVGDGSDELASLRAENARLRGERDGALANYRFMVERAADQKLDGYRELGARAAAAENELDDLRAQLAKVRADLETMIAVHDEVERDRDEAVQRNEDLVRMLDVAVRNASEAAAHERDDIVEALWSMEEAQLRDDDRRVVRRAIRIIESRNPAPAGEEVRDGEG